MQHYFLVLGVALVVGAFSLLLARLHFVRKAATVPATVSRTRRMHFVHDSDAGPSLHIEIEFVNDRGEQCRRTIDNSLLAYLYRPGQKLELAVSGDRVLVKSLFHLLTAPLALLALGIATLAITALLN